MRKGTVTINDETFELFKADPGSSARFTGTGAAYDEIYGAYVRPSHTKVRVWHEWCEWCYELNKNGSPCELMIAKHNSMKFSIAGKVQFNGHVYQLWITRDHNRAYLIV